MNTTEYLDKLDEIDPRKDFEEYMEWMLAHHTGVSKNSINVKKEVEDDCVLDEKEYNRHSYFWIAEISVHTNIRFSRMSMACRHISDGEVTPHCVKLCSTGLRVPISKNYDLQK